MKLRTLLILLSTIILISCSADTSSKSSILFYNKQMFIGHEIVTLDEYEDLENITKVEKKLENRWLFKPRKTVTNELKIDARLYQANENTILGHLYEDYY